MKDRLHMADKKKIKSEASSSNSINNGGAESVVDDVGRRRSSCGYCKSGSNTSITHGLWAHSLTVYDYQALLDRGWRRSGCFLYKPEMEKTCCPSYTIRLKASDFVPSKEQVRVSKRMQRFLDGSLNVKKPDEQNETSRDSNGLSKKDTVSSVQGDVMVDNGAQMNNLEQVTYYLSKQIDSVVLACTDSGEFPSDVQFSKSSVKSVAPAKRKLQAETAEVLLYSSNISFQIAAALRRANKSIHQKDDHCVEPTPKVIAEVLSSHLDNLVSAIGLSVKACNGHINFYSTQVQSQADVIVGKPAVSKDSLTSSGSKGSSSNNSRKLQAKGQSLEIRLKMSSFDPEEYALYRRYQIKVHNDTPNHVTESSYRRFLVDSPLVFVPTSGDGAVPPCGFGSFHQQYLINGRLVAVGVMDILPKCLSSKYLFWDPDLAFLSLGKYSALQEINWVSENQKHCPSLQYYYLGYYIHSCSKMRYKAAYRPSELLCPLRYQWVPFDIARPLLDRKRYVVLSDYATLQNEAASSPHIIEDQTEQEEESFPEESNDIPIDADEEMSELAFEDSDDESGPETTSLSPAEMGKDVGNIVIGLKGMHLKYKDIREAFGAKERNYLETQLHKYVMAVGSDLSERIIYSLG
ncbi:arginyl-tRNA--protein transferase 2-like [Cynara cardunculus var. scolymus]|uniref:Arginyl-tRNA--protein transferase n=1 Tax=Cynara cardunculus var. scolymus TaxID=59895 RepID=A0A103YIU7_CYNCS|nr:arginyl-tRNA--protein transferase 2-like [Cynara cardunculus var. scolymus]KVI09921.1 Acyl-CoA N-acyltransferase [Cynara cardunculus var. scolymus]